MNENNLALNPFKKGKKTEVEGIKKVDVDLDCVIKKAIHQNSILPSRYDEDLYDGYFSSQDTVLLPPRKITFLFDFLLRNNKFIDKDYSGGKSTLKYFTKLVQTSYEHGHNDFFIDTQDEWFNHLFEGLHGRKEDPIKILIRGEKIGANVGAKSYNTIFKYSGDFTGLLGSKSVNSTFIVEGCGEHQLGFGSVDCNYHIKGNITGYLGEASRNSNFTLYGDAGNFLGSNSINCHFDIFGNMEGWCGQKSHYSTFTFHDKDTSIIDLGGKYCKFRSPHKEVYQKLLELVTRGNHAQLIDKDGNILESKKIE